MLPLAYGGPSWSTNRGRPARAATIFSYRPSSAHCRSISGSFCARPARIGKSVLGRLSVSLKSIGKARDYMLEKAHGASSTAPARAAALGRVLHENRRGGRIALHLPAQARGRGHRARQDDL